MQKSKKFYNILIICVIFILLVLSVGLVLLCTFNKETEAAIVSSSYTSASDSVYHSYDKYQDESPPSGTYGLSVRTYLYYDNTYASGGTPPTPSVIVNDYECEDEDDEGNTYHIDEVCGEIIIRSKTFTLNPVAGYDWKSSETSFTCYVGYTFGSSFSAIASSATTTGTSGGSSISATRSGNTFTLHSTDSDGLRQYYYYTPETIYAICTIRVSFSSYSTYLTPKNYTLSFNFNGGVGTGESTTIPVTYTKTISSTAGSATFPANPTRELYSFNCWAVDGTTITMSSVYNWPSNKTAYAQWTFLGYRLTYSVSGGGGTISGVGSEYAKNTTVIATATPNNGYEFDYWTLNGNKVTNNPYTFQITSNSTLVAYFKVKPSLTCQVGSGSGTIDGVTSSYSSGTTVNAIASPAEGYSFDHWTLDGVTKTANPLTFIINSNATLVVYFREVPSVIVTLNNSSLGSVKKMTTETDLYVIIEPVENYYVSSIVLDNMTFPIEYYKCEIYGAGSAHEVSYTAKDTSNKFSMYFAGLYGVSNLTVNLVNSAVTLRNPPVGGAVVEGVATFATLGGESRITGVDVADATYVHVSAVAYSGYSFDNWTVDGEVIGEYGMSANIPFELVNGKIITANFSPINTNVNTDVSN